MDLAIAASNEPDKLVDQLQFALPKPAKYARERRLVQIMPSGSNTFSPNGTQVMTFNVTSYDGWLDPASLRLHFRIFNAAAAPAQPPLIAADLTPAGGCHCFFSQLRILIGGTEVERIEPYAMCHSSGLQ